jgi:YHYH protein
MHFLFQKHTVGYAALALLLTGLVSCGGGGDASTTTTSTTASTTTSCRTASVALDANKLPPGMATLATMSGVTVSSDGTTITIRTQDIPNHSSPYFQVTDPLYITDTRADFRINPSRISAQNYVLRIPAQPACASSTSDTALDAIGVATNGVVFFNQYAAGNAPLTSEIVSFDLYAGHPAQQGNYHYHLEPTFLTASSKSKLIGWALDGFPVYGPQNPDGSTPTLDACNGQFSATPEFPAGIYHYHASSAPPYLIGCYAGTPGSKSN